MLDLILLTWVPVAAILGILARIAARSIIPLLEVGRRPTVWSVCVDLLQLADRCASALEDATWSLVRLAWKGAVWCGYQAFEGTVDLIALCGIVLEKRTPRRRLANFAAKALNRAIEKAGRLPDPHHPLNRTTVGPAQPV